MSCSKSEKQVVPLTMLSSQGANGRIYGAENARVSAYGFVLMYRNHAAREDTIIFPAWKNTMMGGQLDEMSEKFEDIEHEQLARMGLMMP